MKNLKKSILISSAVMLGVAGTLYAANTLTIPTRPAKHDAYLSTLVLGDTTTGKYTLSGSNLIVPEKMIAGGIGGMSKNTISDTARFAVIGGGYGNKVNENAENSVIGAGRLNTISAKNAIIGAGNRNVIRVGADGSFIGGGTNNIADSMVSIAGWNSNTVSSSNSNVYWWRGNRVLAANSVAGGGYSEIGKLGTFSRSDYDDVDFFASNSTYFSPEKENTTIIRTQSGMAINTNTVPAGVNVNVGGAVQMDGQNLLSVACNQNIAWTFEVENGCFYYCDGKYWQALNVAFNEGTNPANPDVTTCSHIGRCEFDGIKIRPWDIVTAYKVERSANCAGERKEIECQQNGTFGADAVYKYSYCMTWDGTSTWIIATYHPPI